MTVHSYGLRDTNILSPYQFNTIKYGKFQCDIKQQISGIGYRIVLNVHHLWTILRILNLEESVVQAMCLQGVKFCLIILCILYILIASSSRPKEDRLHNAYMYS